MMMMLYIALFFCSSLFFHIQNQTTIATQVCREENDDDGGINIEIRETEKQIWSKSFYKNFYTEY